MTTSAQSSLCTAYDPIAGRSCRYYAGHGGKHNFSRLDHDCALERELRRELDEARKALADALGLFDASWCSAHGHSPTAQTFDRAAELKKIVQPDFSRDSYP